MSTRELLDCLNTYESQIIFLTTTKNADYSQSEKVVKLIEKLKSELVKLLVGEENV